MRNKDGVVPDDDDDDDDEEEVPATQEKVDNMDRLIGKRCVEKQSPINADLDARGGKKARVVFVSKKFVISKTRVLEIYGLWEKIFLKAASKYFKTRLRTLLVLNLSNIFIAYFWKIASAELERESGWVDGFYYLIKKVHLSVWFRPFCPKPNKKFRNVQKF